MSLKLNNAASLMFGDEIKLIFKLAKVDVTGISKRVCRHDKRGVYTGPMSTVQLS